MRGKSHPSRLTETLQRVVRRFDPSKRLDVYRLWTFWAEEVGERIAERAQPASYRAGLLTIRVSSQPWMQELQFMKATIRERLNARLGAELIRDIHFVAGAALAPKAPGRASARASTARSPVAPMPPIRNAQLAALFARLVRVHSRRLVDTDPDSSDQ